MHACTVANETPFYKFNDVFQVISKLLCQCEVTMRNRRKCTLFCILMIFLHPYFPWKKSVLKCHHQSASHIFWGNNLINHSKWRHYLTLFLQFFDGWEMNGHIFPSEDDHKHSLKERVAEMYKETFPNNQIFRYDQSINQ